MHRRYRLPVLLFSLCLSVILLFGGAGRAWQVSGTRLAVSEQQSGATAQSRIDFSLTHPVRKTVLENGLTVLTQEVHTAPVVSVQVWYNFGSRDEAPEMRGVAHLLEHMLFQGTRDRPIQFGHLLTSLGSQSNAFTSFDYTAYFNTAERNKLAALLILEADRMQNALIDAQTLAKEKQVVMAELKEYAESAYTHLNRAVMQAVFPNHPYGWSLSGTAADLKKLSVEQVRAYYHQNYRPDNATLVIVGDVQTEAAIQAARDIFGKIPRGEGLTSRQERQVSSAFPPTTPPSGQPIIVREPSNFAFLQVVYPLPAINHPDVPALDVMDYILTAGRTSRLSKALVSLIELGWAIDARGYTMNLSVGGWYALEAIATSPKTLATVEQIFQQIIADLQERGVSQEELERAKTLIRTSTILGRRRIDAQAAGIGSAESVAGDAGFIDRYLTAVERVTAADVQRVARDYLQPERRTVGFLNPTNSVSDRTPPFSELEQPSEDFSPAQPVSPAEVAKYLPPIAKDTRQTRQPLPQQVTLPNGLQILLLADASNPSVSLRGYLAAGPVFDPPNKIGLAYLTSLNLFNGTQTKNAIALAETLENRGISLKIHYGSEGIDLAGASLTSELPILLKTLADLLQNATFPEAGLDFIRQEYLNTLEVSADDPSTLALRTFIEATYPKTHPFHRFPTEQTLNAINRDDLVAFYQRYYRPDTTILSLVGDFDLAQARSQLETLFGRWQVNGATPSAELPPVSLPDGVVRLPQKLPTQTGAFLLMGYPSIERQDPRYYAALILNQILGGGLLSSRLESELRDHLGLIYAIASSFNTGYYGGNS